MEGYPEKYLFPISPHLQLIHNHDAEVYAPWRLVALNLPSGSVVWLYIFADILSFVDSIFCNGFAVLIFLYCLFCKVNPYTLVVSIIGSTLSHGNLVMSMLSVILLVAFI